MNDIANSKCYEISFKFPAMYSIKHDSEEIFILVNLSFDKIRSSADVLTKVD